MWNYLRTPMGDVIMPKDNQEREGMQKDIPQVSDYEIRTSNESSVPQIWGKNPIFAATRQTHTTEVRLSDGAVWRMGVQPPFGKITNSEYLRGFDIRHAELIFKLLAFFRENDISFGHRVDMSYYRLLKIIGWERSKQNLEKLKDVLGDLCSIWTAVVTDNRIRAFKVLSASADWNPQKTENGALEFITFDPSFLDFLGNIELFFSIRLDVWDEITSNIAKAIYLYIPSRALKSTEKKPFKITLVNLYKQINVKIPSYKSDRFKKMTQHKKSVSDQLDNALINYTKKLKVKLEETKDGKDYNFCVWVEDLTDDDYNVPGKDSLRTWFINGRNKSYGAAREFSQLIKNIEPLNGYQIETLQAAEIDWEKSRIFLEQSKTLLGEGTFEWICADVKDKVLCNHHSGTAKPIKSPIAYLITLIRSELLGELPLY